MAAYPRLAYVWLVFSALWIRGGVAFFRDILNTGGPGTGGLLLVVPLAALAIAMGAGGVFVGFALGVGRAFGRSVAVIASIGGLILTGLATPFVLAIGIGLALLFYGGHALSAVALGATPLLFVVTLVGVTLGGNDPSPPITRKRFGLVGALIVGTAFLPPLSFDVAQAPQPSYEEQAAERARYQNALDANDPAVLAEARVWALTFPFIVDDGSQEECDPIEYAVATRRLETARTLFAHKPWGWRADPARARGLSSAQPEMLQLLAEHGVSFADSAGDALRSKSTSALTFALAHGLKAQLAYCELVQMEWMEADAVQQRRAILRAAGATETCTP